MIAAAAERSIGYPGSKDGAGHWQWHVSRMATHAHYVELFAGSAAVFRRKPPALTSTLIDVDHKICAWLRSRAWPATNIERCDAMWWLFANDTRLDEDWLVYADPPYLPETRVKKKVYRHELDEDGHERLLRSLVCLEARVMLCGYASPLYNDYLAAWWCESREVMTRGGLRTECLWTNYNPSRVRRDAAAKPGKNWRERQRIARKVERHVRLFRGMPDYEQDAVLAALLEERRRARRG
jgi:hypothetical protein